MNAVAAAIAGAAVLWVPGAIFSRVLHRDASANAIARFGDEIAAGIAFWPILLLITTTLRLSWTVTGARAFFAVLVLVLVALMAGHRPKVALRAGPVTWAAIVLMAVVAVTRVVQIGGIVYPLWVDSVHHVMIIRLIVEHGALPHSYAPFIANSTFYYHWGFHAVVAFISWITGVSAATALPRLLLFFGQVLNVLVFPSVFGGALALLRSRRAALLAASVATLVSFFPAYYVSWGRYTQLCGLLIVPSLAVAVWKLGRHPAKRRVLHVALLSAGLVLVHVRVAAIFTLLALILGSILALQRHWSGLRHCAAAAVAGMILTAPWLIALATTAQVRTILAPAAAQRAQWETANGVPDDILWAPNNVPLISTATGGLIAFTPVRHMSTGARAAAIGWWLVLVVLLQKHGKRYRGVERHDGWRIAIPVTWIALTALVINLDSLGLPRFRLLSNSAAIIMLFLPLSIIAAHLVRWACDEIVSTPRRTAAMIAVTITIGFTGAASMLHIVNPQTILVTPADRDALSWIRSHTPANATFAVGVQPWIGGSYMGVDGGCWIPVVSDRHSMLPPGLYPWVMSRDEAMRVSDTITSWYRGQESPDPHIVTTLRQAGITHVFFGSRNTAPIRRAIGAWPWAERVYDAGGVEIYAIRPTATSTARMQKT